MKKFSLPFLLLVIVFLSSATLKAVFRDARLDNRITNVDLAAANQVNSSDIAAKKTYQNQVNAWDKIKNPEPPSNKANTSEHQTQPIASPINVNVNTKQNSFKQPTNKITSLDKIKLEPEKQDSENRVKIIKEKQAKLVNELLNIDYGTQSVPRTLYNRDYTEYNNHLPPVYFKSYYLSLAFKAAKEDNQNGINAVLTKYNFINGQNKDGDTLLMYAVQNNSLKVARLLLAKGAYVNAVNLRKRTALHYAATMGAFNLSRLLLSMGADYTLTDDLGMTPIDYAKATRQDKIVDLIERYMRKDQ